MDDPDLRRVMDGVNEHAIVLVDDAGRVRVWNRAAERVTGFSADDTCGAGIGAFFPEHDGWAERKDGTRYWAAVTRSALSDGGMVVVARDETVRHEALAASEEYAEDLERSNRDLSEFASVVAHDLKAPLAVVTGYGELLRDLYSEALDPDALTYIERMVSQARQMTVMVTSLLAYARVGATDEPIDAVDTTEAVAIALANLEAEVQATGATVNVSDLPTVWGAPTLLGQLFQNLIANAIKFRGDDPPVVDITAVPGDSEWELAVIDNGVGVPADHRDLVFDMFHRVDPAGPAPGTGIGLAVARRIVQRHGGRIWLEPGHDGLGTAVRFTLRAAEDET